MRPSSFSRNHRSTRRRITQNQSFDAQVENLSYKNTLLRWFKISRVMTTQITTRSVAFRSVILVVATVLNWSLTKKIHFLCPNSPKVTSLCLLNTLKIIMKYTLGGNHEIFLEMNIWTFIGGPDMVITYKRRLVGTAYAKMEVIISEMPFVPTRIVNKFTTSCLCPGICRTGSLWCLIWRKIGLTLTNAKIYMIRVLAMINTLKNNFSICLMTDSVKNTYNLFGLQYLLKRNQRFDMSIFQKTYASNRVSLQQSLSIPWRLPPFTWRIRWSEVQLQPNIVQHYLAISVLCIFLSVKWTFIVFLDPKFKKLSGWLSVQGCNDK